ncbi:MAG: zinc-binding dehydrogenase, partial [Spirochaetaceae bacterium]|nr:zinc-binding dehydrogenase [Spirochaetaceae bacterium]
KALGAEVWISDISQGKLDIAKTFGIDGTILNSSKEAFDNGVAKITESNGFDVTIEAVGLPSTFIDCIDAACFGGHMVLVGVGKRNADFNFTLLQKKELNVYGSRNALKKDFIELIDIVKRGDVPLDKIITNTYSFDEAQRAFSDFDANTGDMLKVVIDFTK